MALQKIYTRDEAVALLELFEDVLERYEIKVPSPEDAERAADNGAPLYGSVYLDLLDDVEEHIAQLLSRHKRGVVVIQDEFSGNI